MTSETHYPSEYTQRVTARDRDLSALLGNYRQSELTEHRRDKLKLRQADLASRLAPGTSTSIANGAHRDACVKEHADVTAELNRWIPKCDQLRAERATLESKFNDSERSVREHVSSTSEQSARERLRGDSQSRKVDIHLEAADITKNDRTRDSMNHLLTASEDHYADSKRMDQCHRQIHNDARGTDFSKNLRILETKQEGHQSLERYVHSNDSNRYFGERGTEASRLGISSDNRHHVKQRPPAGVRAECNASAMRDTFSNRGIATDTRGSGKQTIMITKSANTASKSATPEKQEATVAKRESKATGIRKKTPRLS